MALSKVRSQIVHQVDGQEFIGIHQVLPTNNSHCGLFLPKLWGGPDTAFRYMNFGSICIIEVNLEGTQFIGVIEAWIIYCF
jgi:hypothetical protein